MKRAIRAGLLVSAAMVSGRVLRAAHRSPTSVSRLRAGVVDFWMHCRNKAEWFDKVTK